MLKIRHAAIFNSKQLLTSGEGNRGSFTRYQRGQQKKIGFCKDTLNIVFIFTQRSFLLIAITDF